MRPKVALKAWLSALACASAVSLIAEGPAVGVQVGDPTLWTLEQAHYQLARQRVANAQLETSPPTADKLDPNATHGAKLDQLRTLFALSASFDQTIGVSNASKVDTFRSAVQRREQLTARLDAYRARSLELTEQIGAIKREIARLDPADAASIAQRQGDVQTLEAVKAELSSQISTMTTELATQPSLGDLRSVDPPMTTTLPESAVKELLDSQSAGVREPRLHASTILDNFIQMQYELIVKQLALMRDDIGLDHRLVFVELPISIYTVGSKEADDRLVRSEYVITRITECTTQRQFEAALRRPLSEATPEYREKVATCFPDLRTGTGEPLAAGNPRPLTLGQIRDAASAKALDDGWPNPFRDVSLQRDGRDGGAARGSARVVDLIPRQSALNVNSVHDEVSGLRLSAAFTWLTGIGGKSSYERQREKFEQFLHQDIFASGYGKGTPAFGWTFGPNPGSKRIAPGVRNTFAAIVVPRSAVAMELQMSACPYRRKDPPPSCGNPRAAEVKIPTQHEGFWVHSIRYSPVLAGQVATVFLHGDYFSPQLSVLINGVPLRQQVDLARNFVPRPAGDLPHGVHGDFEYVNQELVVLRFSMGADFNGTPRIVLVTPQKAMEINRLELNINSGKDKAKLLCDRPSACPPMFRSMTLAELRVVSITPDTANPSTALVRAHVIGTGFTTGDAIEVNGSPATKLPTGDRPAFHDVSFSAPAGEEWIITVQPPLPETKSPAIVEPTLRLSIRNPLLLKKGESKARFHKAGGGQPARAAVTVSGGPFDSALDTVAVDGRVLRDAVFSSGEISFEITNPPAAFEVVVRRAGTKNGVRWSIVK